ncbi:transcription termination factor NusA [Candidatus Parcubacteria bacterium]|nr:transcription termination factor NusA [Candidatus Parcubacteria bacterium]
MPSQFLAAINQMSDEKGLPREIIIETVEAALAAAYKKDYGDKDQEVRVELDQETGEPHVYVSKEVVTAPENEFLQISKKAAQAHRRGAKVGETIEYEDNPEGFGRVAAQTAKQVIIQRIREAEREIVFSEYKDKEDMVLGGVVQRIEGGTVYVDLGKAVGILFSSEQIPGERTYMGQRLKVYVVRVEQTTRGPQIVLSRAHPGLVRHLFSLEVPEIEAGSVRIREVAREAGVRTKIAVESTVDGVDAVGTFVGGRGSRVQAVMSELGEEKIDIILYSEDAQAFITNALSPTKVINVTLDDGTGKAVVKVPEDQLSLAIGKQGQNVRLAAKLTGWNIDITSADESRVEAAAEAADPAPPRRGKGPDLEGSLIQAVNQQAAGETAPSEPEQNASS